MISILFLIFFLGGSVYDQMFNQESGKVKIYLEGGGIRRIFNVDKGYLPQPNDPPVRDALVLTVGYPDMLPRARSNVPAHESMLIVIHPGNWGTMGEHIVKRWQENKDRDDLGPGFKRFVGMHAGYDVYETSADPKTGVKTKTRIFKDENGNFVADGERSDARISGLVVVYGPAAGYAADPKELHQWVKEFLRKIENNEFDSSMSRYPKLNLIGELGDKRPMHIHTISYYSIG